LRQLVHAELLKRGKKCNCIRCREIGLSFRDKNIDFEKEFEKAKLGTEFYSASKGEEAFVSFESRDNLFGFVRLRVPFSPFMKEISGNAALVRELHVFGKGLPLGERSFESFQHRGLGKELMLEAERIAKEKFSCDKMVVISGLGVKEYYRKQLGYKKAGSYMAKSLK
jgi:elongator complex protein 3